MATTNSEAAGRGGVPLSTRASCVIPCYNLGKYVREAVDSALASQFDSFDVVLVDDGSTEPATIEAIAGIERSHGADSRFRLLRQNNQGLAMARNNGIKLARGQYILPIDADNSVGTDYLAKAAKVLDENPRVGVVYAYARCMGDRTGVWQFAEFDRQRILLENCADACSMFRRGLWDDCGGFDARMPVMGQEDWDLWIGAMERGWEFHLLREPLFNYRVRPDSMIANCAVPANRMALMRYIVEKHRNTYMSDLAYVVSGKDLQVWELRKLLEERTAEAGALRAQSASRSGSALAAVLRRLAHRLGRPAGPNVDVKR